MTNDKILLIGGGGHCKSVLDSLINCSNYSDIAILDMEENLGKKILSCEIIGTDEDLKRLYQESYRNAFITVGSVGDSSLRLKLFKRVKLLGFNIPSIIDPTAIVSKDAVIGEGVFIGKNAVVNSGVVIYDGAIINTGAIIEHDCTVGKFSHISPGAVLCGEVVVEEDVHVGASAVLKQQVSIGKRSIIGIGSVVINNIPPNSVAYGNPCKSS